MSTIRIMGETKYFKSDVVDNEDFYKAKEFALELILNNKIKRVDMGASYHYMKGIKNIKAYMSMRAKRNDKSLIS